MKLNTLIRRLPMWYQAACDERQNSRIRSWMLISPPGRGKTETLVYASTLLSNYFNKNIGHVVISGPLLTPADAVGYLVPKNVEGHMESVYTDPFWFRTKEGKRLDEYDGGIIIVDEADKMDTDVKKVIGEAALSGRLGPHQLKGTWVVWFAGNRKEDRSGSTKELDHLINRRAEVHIEDDIDSWEDWALRNDVSPVTITFAKEHIAIVFPEAPPVKQGPWCTPRSLVMLDSYLQSISNGGPFPTDNDTKEEAAGMIGAPAQAAFFTHLMLENETPSYEEIVANPKQAKVPNRPDAAMLVCYKLAHKITVEAAENIITYVERMPKEFAVTFATAACKKNHNLVKSPAFSKWALQNSALMAAIALRQ